MAHIYNENLVSQVNGSRTVFTLNNNISTLTVVIFDGAPYIGSVAITGSNEITLGDAPQYSLDVTYDTAAPTGVAGYITVDQALTSFQRLKKDISDVPQATFIEWCDYLNQFVYRELESTDPERYIIEYTLTTNPGQQAYSLPGDFRDVTQWGTGIYQTDQRGVRLETRLARTGFGSQTLGYYIKGSSLYLTPIPRISYVYILRYIPLNASLTSLSDSTQIPTEYLNYVIKALDVFYNQWDEQPDAEGLSDSRFARVLDELIRAIRKESDSYGFLDYSTTF